MGAGKVQYAHYWPLYITLLNLSISVTAPDKNTLVPLIISLPGLL
jgi:hypothetical protein